MMNNRTDKKIHKNIVKPKEVYKIESSVKNPNFRPVAFNITDDVILKGKLRWEGLINDNEEVFGIITDCPVEDGTDGTFNNKCIFRCERQCGILLRKSSNLLDLNNDGTVKCNSNYGMKDGKGKYFKEECVSFNIDNTTKYGKIIKVAEINGILCYEIELNRCSSKNSVFVIEKDINDEICDPIKYDVHTYYKKGAYVQLNKFYYGVVRKYILIRNVFHYLIDTDMEEMCVGLNDVRYGVELEMENKAFITVDDPDKYCIITTLKKGSAVQILSKKNIFHGHISWMGFDGERNFKFGITLEKRCGSDNGMYYGQTLFKAEVGYATLALTSDVAPDGRFPQEEKRRSEPSKKSTIESKYHVQMYKISDGDFFGIQGNLNSCYLDTSIFAMFAFNSFLDNMILADLSGDDMKKNKMLQSILKDNIVNPLRKNHFVSYDQVAIFREQLQELSPKSKFIMNERDPEELMETLFHLLTPKDFLLKTKCFNDIFEQRCFLTQLFYQHVPEERELNLLEMLTLTFLECKMLISTPPKALIIQLPRHGRDLKRFKTVKIPSKLDIASLIVVSSKKCSECNSMVKEINMCIVCSMKDYSLKYFCNEHKDICKHKSIQTMEYKSPLYNGAVELDLVAILCIERTHYIAYVKNNEQHSKWVYFNSMERLVNGEFIPHIRKTSLNCYFENQRAPKSDTFYQSDVDKIENYAFVCFYKNACMEMYSKDFNAEK